MARFEPRGSEIRPDPPSRFWKVAIVEDHLLQRQRTEEILESQPDLKVVHSSETLPDFIRWLRTADPRVRPHLLILDLMVERQPSVDPRVVQKLVDAGLRVLVLSALASPSLVRSILKAGVGGVVGKRDSVDEIVRAVWAVLRRDEWITPEVASVIAGDAQRPRLSIQEERALVLYASGLTLGDVAEAMGVKLDTAKTYLSRVKRKYAELGRHARTKLDLSRVAAADGLLDEQV